MIIPDKLKEGDKVAVVAPAKKVDQKTTREGIAVLESWKLNVFLGRHVFDSHHQFAGTDAQRADDLQQMINHPEIKAIFMVRGGYGSTRIIDQIDFSSLLHHPKWICGFSDITAFNLHLYKLGICSLHGPMPSFFYALNAPSLQWFKDYLFGKTRRHKISSHPLNRKGQAQGKLTGGNLSIICHTIGTPSEITTEGNILFLEDVGEHLYNIDRMLVQLKRAGKLNNLAGLVAGQFSDLKSKKSDFGLDSYEIIRQHVDGYDYPVMFGFPFGHTADNYAIPIGGAANIEIDAQSAALILSE